MPPVAAAPRRRSASMPRKSTGLSMPQAMAGAISRGSSSMFAASPQNDGSTMTTFKDARAFLLKHRTDYDAAVKGFRWPEPVPFNWALDWFDAELAGGPRSKGRHALWV